jgi:5,10-methylenetetrahydrofolate reductase
MTELASGGPELRSTPSRLARRLAAGRFVVTAEVNPPRHADPEAVRKQARRLRGAVDAVNLTDCTRGILRMSSVAAALLVQDEGIEPIVQMTCRDRNRIALQSELLGLSALSLHNVLLLTGDDPTQGDHPDAKPVFDLNGTSVLAAAHRLRSEGRSTSGRAIAHAPSLFLGAAGDPERDLAQADKPTIADKAAAGADFIQTQPVFDFERFEAWMDLVRAAGLQQRMAILAGVFVLDSAKRARFLQSVPGVVLPERIVERLAQAPDEQEEGLRIAVETANCLLTVEGIRGVHLMGIEAASAMRTVVERSDLAAHVRAEAVAS